MSETVAPAESGHSQPHAPHGSLGGAGGWRAIGVVYGDIGTSPLYALQAILTGAHPMPIVVGNIYGVISLMFLDHDRGGHGQICLRIIMRCDNNGEGGSLAAAGADQPAEARYPQMELADGLRPAGDRAVLRRIRC